MGSVSYTTYRRPNLEGVWTLAIRNLHRLTPRRVTVPDQARDLPERTLSREVSDYSRRGVNSTPSRSLTQGHISQKYPDNFQKVSGQFSGGRPQSIRTIFQMPDSEVSGQFLCPIEDDRPTCSKVSVVCDVPMTKKCCRRCGLPIDRSNTPSGNLASVSTCGKCYLIIKRQERQSLGLD